MKAALGRIALLVASVLATLGVFEIGLRLAGYEPIYEVYSKPSLFWTHDDLLGWRHERSVSGTYVGPRPWPVEYRTQIRINSLGLRGPEIAELPPGGCRILVLGDSYVAGFEVEWQETFLVLIERALNLRFDFPVQVINAGVRGYGTDQAYLYYRTRGRELEPDLVVMFHSGNDPSDNTTLHRMRRPFGKAAFAYRSDGSLELVGYPVPRYPLCSSYALDESFEPVRLDGIGRRFACWLQTRLADHSALFTFLTLRIQRSPGLLRRLYDLGKPPQTVARRVLDAAVLPGVGAPRPKPISVAGSYALTTALYRKLAAAVREDGADFLAVIGSKHYDKFDHAALAIDAIAVHRLEIRSRLLGPRDTHFKNDGHFNALGHRLLAEHLTPVFTDAILRSRHSGSAPRGRGVR